MRYLLIEVREGFARFLDVFALLGYFMLVQFLPVYYAQGSSSIMLGLFTNIGFSIGFLVYFGALLVLASLVVVDTNFIDSKRWFEAYRTSYDKSWRLLLIPGLISCFLVPIYFSSSFIVAAIIFLLFAFVHLILRGVELGGMYAVSFAVFLLIGTSFEILFLSYVLAELILSGAGIGMIFVSNKLRI